MSDSTRISWTDATWSPVTGCTKVSDGCLNCYIERTPPFRMNGRAFACPRCGGTGYVEDSDGNRLAFGKAGKPLLGAQCTRCAGTGRAGVGDTTGVRMHEDRLGVPLCWRKPRKVFVCSMADLFHDSVSSSFIASVFAVMALSPQHTFQVLTKRHGRMQSLLSSPDFHWRVWHAILTISHGKSLPIPPAITAHFRGGARLSESAMEALPNVWLGVSVEDQKTADLRIPALLDSPAAVRWLSCEPLLCGVRLCRCDGAVYVPQRHPFIAHADCPIHGDTHIDWVVVGGESGPNARPMHPDWARSLRDQCASTGVPFHFKQWGEWAPDARGRKPGPRDPKSLVIHPAGMTALTPDNPFDPWERGHPNWRTVMHRVGKKAAGRLLDGVLHDEYPGGAA